MIKLGVPYSGLKTELDIVNTREDEAVAMAAGINLAGGESCVYIQDDGFLHATNIITTLLMPYGIEIFIQIIDRNDVEHHKQAHFLKEVICRCIGEKLPSV